MQIFLLVFFIVVGLIAGLLIYQSLPNKLKKNNSNNQSVNLNNSTASYRTYDFTIPDKVNTLAKPKNPLDITLEYGYELSPNQALTEAKLENAILLKSGKDAKKNILSLEKNGIKIELPMIGIIGLQTSKNSESKPVVIEQIYDFLKVGDKLNVRMHFAGSNINLTNSEIITIFEQKLKGDPNFELMMKTNSMLGIKKLSEYEFIKRLNNKPVTFIPEELIITSINRIN